MSSKGRKNWPYELAGTSAVVRECVEQVHRAAGDDRHVLVAAEPGLDPEAVAAALHRGGPRRTRPFVVQPCAGLSPGELERALLGSAQRAAELETISATCALARAQGGVLFLRDVDELPAPLQRRLARILRDGEVRMVRRSSPVASRRARRRVDDQPARSRAARRSAAAAAAHDRTAVACASGETTCRRLPRRCWRHATATADSLPPR